MMALWPSLHIYYPSVVLSGNLRVTLNLTTTRRFKSIKTNSHSSEGGSTDDIFSYFWHRLRGAALALPNLCNLTLVSFSVNWKNGTPHTPTVCGVTSPPLPWTLCHPCLILTWSASCQSQLKWLDEWQMTSSVRKRISKAIIQSTSPPPLLPSHTHPPAPVQTNFLQIQDYWNNWTIMAMRVENLQHFQEPSYNFVNNLQCHIRRRPNHKLIFSRAEFSNLESIVQKMTLEYMLEFYRKLFLLFLFVLVWLMEFREADATRETEEERARALVLSSLCLFYYWRLLSAPL